MLSSKSEGTCFSELGDVSNWPPRRAEKSEDLEFFFKKLMLKRWGQKSWKSWKIVFSRKFSKKILLHFWVDLVELVGVEYLVVAKFVDFAEIWPPEVGKSRTLGDVFLSILRKKRNFFTFRPKIWACSTRNRRKKSNLRRYGWKMIFRKWRFLGPKMVVFLKKNNRKLSLIITQRYRLGSSLDFAHFPVLGPRWNVPSFSSLSGAVCAAGFINGFTYISRYTCFSLRLRCRDYSYSLLRLARVFSSFFSKESIFARICYFCV